MKPILLAYFGVVGLIFTAMAQEKKQLPTNLTLSAPPDLRNKPGLELDSTGWHFANRPRAEFIDERSGTIRFELVVSETGQLETVTPVMSTVSAKQEQLCRQALLKSTFVSSNPKAKRATGFYTFRFVVR